MNLKKYLSLIKSLLWINNRKLKVIIKFRKNCMTEKRISVDLQDQIDGKEDRSGKI